MITFLTLLVGFISLAAFLMMRRYKYWERKNVQTGKVVPFFGDLYDICMGQTSAGGMILDLYNKVPSDHRYVGVYFFHVPVLVARTPEMVKQICVKDWDHFANHGNIIMNSSDDMWQKAIFPLKGQEWKEARRVNAPIVNGNKVKLLFPLIERHAKKLTTFIKEKKQDAVEIDGKDIILRVLNDIAWDATLGMEVDSLKDPNNIFFDVGVKTVNLSTPYKKIVMMLYMMCENIPKLLHMTLFGDGESFFVNTVKETVRMREETGLKRPDLIGILLDAREEQLKAQADEGEEGKKKEVLTDEVMASYVFVTYLAMTDSITTVMAFLTWELAMAPEIQEKLRQECDKIPSGGGEVTFQDINDMRYMDMVISEALRKWPAAAATDRVVTKPYTIEPELPHEKPVHLDVGDNIFIPIYAIHHDPKNYENPDKFDPERFSLENRYKLDSNAFLPFGVGPRFCGGTRLAIVMMKVMLYHLMRSFEIVPVDKTPNPLVLDKETVNLCPVGGFPLGLKERK